MKNLLSSLVPWLSLGILCLVAFVSIKMLFAPPNVLTNTERILEIRQDSVHHWMDEQMRSHGTAQLVEADVAVLRGIYPKLDSVLHVLRIQSKQLQSLTAFSSRTSGTVRPQIEVVPGGGSGGKDAQRFSYSDRWLDLKGVLSDTPFVRYSTYDSFIVTSYWKKKGFLGLGRKDVFIDAYSLNPAARIDGLTGLKVSTERPKRFGIGPYLGYGWDGQRWAPSAGISIHYSLIKF